ncbi:Hypothetical predicted protein, partial [Paramuricea clavata]
MERNERKRRLEDDSNKPSYSKRALQKHESDSSDEEDYTPYVPLKDRRKQELERRAKLLNKSGSSKNEKSDESADKDR